MSAGAKYYLKLRYWIALRELAPEEGGGYIATIPQLGSATFCATGESACEALESLDTLRRDLIPRLLERGIAIPEPEPDS